MSQKSLLLAGCVAAATFFVSNASHAAVIAGPVLFIPGGGYSVTGLRFQADDNAILTSFVYQNEGKADTVVLTDALGNILDSVATPASTPTYTASVHWALTSGDTYFLLQTAFSNEYFANFETTLPSDADITLTASGTFSNTIAGAITLAHFPPNAYWAAFNDITTVAVPEPATAALLIASLAGLGATLRRGRKRPQPAA